MAGEYLPPVVTRLTGELDDLAATIAKAKALFDSLNTEVEIKVSTRGIAGPVAGAIAQIEALKAALAGLDSKTISISVAGAGLAGVAAGAAGGAAGGGIAWLGGITFLNLLSLIHLGLAVLSTQIIADTAGIVAFGLAATHAIGPAVSAVNNLTTAYSGLDNYQKAAALSLHSFLSGLQTQDEAGIFGVFYQGLSLVQTALGHSGGIVTSATQAFSDFAAMLKADFASSAWADVFGRNSGLVRTDLDALFRLINSGINLIPALFHNFNFLGLGFLNIVSGTLRATAAIMEWNPVLTKSVALAGAAYAAYKLLWVGMFGGAGPIKLLAGWLTATLIPALRNAMITTTAFFMNLRAEGAGMAVSTLVSALNPLVLTATALAAVAAAAYGVSKALSSGRQTITQGVSDLQTMYHATGNNVQGFLAMAKAVDTNRAALEKLQGGQLPGFLTYLATYFRQQAATITQNAGLIGQALGLTRGQVIAFATATGVNLATALQRGSIQFALAESKIRGYATAVALSHNPMAQFRVDAMLASSSTQTLTQQVQDLQAAYQSLVSPTISVIQGAVTFKQDQLALADAAKKANGVVGLQTAAQRTLANALAAAANDALTQSANIKQQTGSTQLAIAPLMAMISQIERLGLHGKMAAELLHELKLALDALQSKTITISVRLAGAGAVYVQGAPGHITGGGPSGSSSGNAIIPNDVAFGGRSPAVASAGDTVIEAHFYLDGKELFGGVKSHTYKYNVRNGNRTSGGRPRGVMVPRS